MPPGLAGLVLVHFHARDSEAGLGAWSRLQLAAFAMVGFFVLKLATAVVNHGIATFTNFTAASGLEGEAALGADTKTLGFAPVSATQPSQAVARKRTYGQEGLIAQLGIVIFTIPSNGDGVRRLMALVPVCSPADDGSGARRVNYSRAAASAALSVALGRIIALHFSASAR